MLKRIFFLFLAAIVLLTVCVLPASAYVVTEDNRVTAIAEALLTLDEDCYRYGSVTNVSYKTSNFTNSPSINYTMLNGRYMVDPSGYTIFVCVPTSEYNSNVVFYSNLAIYNESYFPGFEFNKTYVVGDYTFIYYSFTFNEYVRVFAGYPGSDVAQVFNISCSSNSIGSFSRVNWGFCSNSAFYKFQNNIDSLTSFNNGYADGTNVISSPFDGAAVYLSYYYLGSWHPVIPLNMSANLSDYLSPDMIDLSLLTGFNFNFSDIPAGATQVTLSLKLPLDLYAPAYKFSSYNASNLIQSAPASPYGVFFSDQLNSLFGNVSPSEALINGSNVTYSYYFPVANDNNYTYFNVALDPIVVRSLTSSTVINDYVSYQLVDYNSLVNQYYDQGYNNGYSNGDEAGKSAGYQDGYLKGKAEGLQMAQNGDFFSLFSALIDAPVNAFTNLLSFEIFNQNVAGFVLSILSLILVFKIVKVVI